MVIDDLPEIQVTKKGPSAGISISPVSDELIYTLQGTFDGTTGRIWPQYVCKEDAEIYTFPGVHHDKKVKEYRVRTRLHYGLPIHDPFSLDGTYKAGPLRRFRQWKEFSRFQM